MARARPARQGCPPRTGHAATRLLRDRFVFIQQEGQGKGYTCRNDEHHEVLNRLRQAQQDTEDAGHARTRSGEVREGTHKRARRTTCAPGEKGLEETQVHTEDSGLGDAHECGERRRKRKALDLGVARLEGDGECGPTLGDVCRAGDGQPERHAILSELAEVDGRIHLMDARDHGGSIEQADNGGADAER